MEHGGIMPVVDESIVEQQWSDLTETERAFERLSRSDLYRKWMMISHFRRELRAYHLGPDNQLQQSLDRVLREERNRI